MSRFILILLLIDCIIPPNTNAQLQKPADYFPQHVGDVWEYRTEAGAFRYRNEVIGDTLLADTLQVFKTVQQFWWGTGESTYDTYHF